MVARHRPAVASGVAECGTDAEFFIEILSTEMRKTFSNDLAFRTTSSGVDILLLLVASFSPVAPSQADRGRLRRGWSWASCLLASSEGELAGGRGFMVLLFCWREGDRAGRLRVDADAGLKAMVAGGSEKF